MSKKINFNWGWGIAVFYGAFLVIAIGSAIFVSNLDYFMVSQDYYQEGIDYQDQIEKVKRTNALDVPVSWNYDPILSIIQFNYPAELSSGKIVFYRPSNSNLDRYVRINRDDSSRQFINVQNWAKGFWKIKVDWQTENDSYYNEGTIDLK